MQKTVDYPSDQSQEQTVSAADLRQLLVKIYVKAGMFQAEAEMAADRQVEADLRGIQSHGSRATPRYVRAIDVGDVDPRGQALTLVKTVAMAVLDGGRNLGHVTASRAMRMAIDMAREVGTGTVGVKNSHHLGAASVYALMAAREGMIGYCTTSTGRASVAAYGSPLPAVANNAFAWAAPSRTGAPFCLDMACAAASWGKIDALKMYGQPLPEHWALNAQGEQTTNPAEAKILLPAAGARGFGLAYQCSILAGPLVGGKMPLHKTKHPEAEDTEHFFYCLDVARFGDLDRFYNELDRTADEIRALSPEASVSRVILPGDMEFERAAQWERDGIPLHRDHLNELAAVAAKFKIPVPWKAE
ncbi:MAG: Ldh family oxidoreductase [Planctomycetota bacterium]|nr:Ldh family oxidoreductase [Planctomycetota bacterium]